MKKLRSITYSIVALCALSILLTACEDDEFCRNGRGSIEITTLDVASFSGIHLKRNADVFIQQGDDQFVEIRAQENVIDELDVEVINGILVIDLKRCFYSMDMDVFVTVSQPLSLLEISGSGDIFSEEKIVAADELELAISGSGDIRLETDALDIESSISGSGEIKLLGQAENHKLRISGSGDLKAFDCPTVNHDISVSGSGDSDIFVDGGDLSVRISGSGEVRYKGSPASVESSVSGSGRIINAN